MSDPQSDGSYEDAGQVGVCPFVVSCGDASVVLKPGPEAFHGVALSIGDGVVGSGVFALGAGWDDGLGLSLGQALPEVIGIIALVRQQFAERSGGTDQGMSHGDVGQIAWAQQQDARSPLVVHQTVDFGRSPASGTAYALSEGPPFAPAAER